MSVEALHVDWGNHRNYHLFVLGNFIVLGGNVAKLINFRLISN